MDIGNEASIVSFKIEPTTTFEQCTALHVLLHRSVAHFRRRVLRLVLYYVYKIRYFMGSHSSWWRWFRPLENPLHMLVFLVIGLFSVRKFYGKYTSRKYDIDDARLLKSLKCAKKYDEWAMTADKLYKRSKKKTNDADLYDVELVKNKLEELKHRREHGSVRDIMFCMRADLVRNLGNMCNPELHRGRPFAPQLIRDYMEEVTRQLDIVCDAGSNQHLTLEERVSFVQETRHAFGRTALILSGGASLGAFHIGVVETLIEHKLLPRIIAGSSVGSIMASLICTKSTAELQGLFHSPVKFFTYMGGVVAQIERVRTHGAIQHIKQLQEGLRKLTGNMTFGEAFTATGQVLGITVCSTRKHEPPRLLNYLTSPHVTIWSAVTASCAFPGLFEAQELMAKDRYGNFVPYHPPFHCEPELGGGSPRYARRWRDGSLEADLPTTQLRELFNVNHFIVSQANPHIAPLLRFKDHLRYLLGSYGAKIAKLAEMELKHRCKQMVEMGFPMGKLFAQDWEGDVTIVMSATAMQYLKIIKNPSESDIKIAADQGRKCTFEKISAIKANCEIELALDKCIARLNQRQRLRRSADRAAGIASQGSVSTTNASSGSKFSNSKRIPSWNCLARAEEENFVANRNSRNRQNPSDHGSDSDLEHGGDHSWTRSGGPLMRTISAEEFVDFVQKLDGVDSEFKTQLVRKEVLNEDCDHSPSKEDENENDDDDDEEEVVYGGGGISINGSNISSSSKQFQDCGEVDQRVSSSSILVNSGDFLHTRFVNGGMELNVVRKDDLTTTASSSSSSTSSSSSSSKEDHNPESDNNNTAAVCCTTVALGTGECLQQFQCSYRDLDTISISATTSAASEGSFSDNEDPER